MDRRVFEGVRRAVVEGVWTPGGGDPGEYVRAASLNKVLLHFLRVSGVDEGARLREEARFRLYLTRLEEVVGALDGLRFAVFKARKPVAYVPSDIDVLVDAGQAWRAAGRLRRLGFRVEVVEPYCITMTRGGAIVDIYVNPTLGGVAYLDGGRLLDHTVEGRVYGVSAPVLSDEAELVAVAAHAVLKERVYTLNDYAALLHLYTPRALDLAEELGVKPALLEALRIHGLVDSGALTLPHRIPLARWALLLASKLARDPLTRSTALNVLRALGDRRLGALVSSKLLRETY